MKGIQINNFFNNHISLNGKKSASKQPNVFSEQHRPQPIVFNHNEEEPDQMTSYDALTPQMKAFGKQPINLTRKKRTNTIEPVSKPRENKKSKGKKSNSYQKFKKTVSLDKYNEKDVSEEQDASKTLSKHYKKPKTSRNKNQQSEGVKRSKSAIIKNTHSKAIQPKQTSRQFLKQAKKNNIISADSSFKDASKRQIKKETQHLLNRKEHVEKVECKTARVQSTKVKSRKNKDKIIGEINNRSAQKDDKKGLKFLTERKTTGISGSKSYLTSAKQSKPTSARDNKKPNKKLFDSKEKDYYRIEDDVDTFRNLEDFIKDTGRDDNSEVKEALNELQSVLQGISSKKDLAKELKKFTFKLKNFPSNNNSGEDQSSLSQEEESNSEAFKRIKDFKNNLVKKKLNEAKEDKVQQETQTHRQQISSSKKSSKKLLKPKKKLQDPNKHTKKPAKAQNLDSNEGQMIQSSNQNQDTSEPEAFKNTEEEESKYINSRNVSEFYEKEKTPKSTNQKIPIAINCEQDDEDEALDASNKKYMEFLKNLQAEGQNQPVQNLNQSQEGDKQKSDDLIGDINSYLNRQYVQMNKEYSSQRPKDLNQESQNNNNPLLERRRWDGYPVQNSEEDQMLKNYLSEHDHDAENNNLEEEKGTYIEIFNRQKLSQIEELKCFQKQSDQMMTKAGINNKLEQKKKNLTIQLNQDIAKLSQLKSNESKTPSSPKYDDRYPHMMKSPKFSDIEITNILAAKQKCLASKHQKMNELIQRMYEKELVSPKSYEYYVYQLKKQYDEESEGFDGFKEQASQILNEINQEKNDIKVIDELIREERWDEARKLMKENQKASGFFGFKKNREKVYQTYETKQKPQLAKQVAVEVEISPTKRQNIAVIQNNINITIKPQVQAKPSVEVKKNQKQKPKEQAKIKGGLIRQKRQISYSSSDEDQQQGSENEESITKKLDFDFEQKYRLKSNQDDFSSRNAQSNQNKFDTELDSYLNAEKADSQDFEHYVYYQSQSNEETIKSEPSREDKSQEKTQRLKPEGIFKLFQVAQGEDDSQEQKKSQSDQDDLSKYERVIISSTDQDKIMKIDEQEPKESNQKEDQLGRQDNKPEHVESEDQSDNGSILELELRKGFESNLFFIKEYCISLCQYIRDSTELKSQFRQDISQPMQFETQNLLKKYRKALDGTYNDDYNSTVSPLSYKTELRKAPNKAISSQLAKEFNKTYGPLKFWNKDLSKKGREKFNMEKEAEQIFLSAILEVLNESLDFQRPGSIFGKPLCWANKSKHLKNMKYLHGQKTKKVTPSDAEQAAETYDFIFGVAIARIIQWGSCLCGFLPDTAELENTQIDDDYVVHIRETRMAFLLQKMLAEEEATFNNSELQETEIMLWLGKAISQELINEAAQEFAFINSANEFDFN